MANFSASQREDLRVINDSENAQSGVQMSTFISNSDLPPPYTVTNVTSTPIQPEIIQSQPAVYQVQQVILTPGILRKKPTYVLCPHCHQSTVTSVKLVNTQKTDMLAGFICGSTSWCMLCCLSVIPYIIPTCKNADHYCSHCNYYIGSYSNSK